MGGWAPTRGANVGAQVNSFFLLAEMWRGAEEWCRGQMQDSYWLRCGGVLRSGAGDRCRTPIG